ncbi:MAG: sigma-54-dependent Fis family transcriptional regulator, partial [Myxococcales bacterium]|nr:sigma-54-dependent Fis family transcriptional regulator [Myxococcales bacterium]
FVAINCAAVPAELADSEIFGHERGAFTDAHRPRVGLVRQAQGGVLFLDEIGDMPQSLQPKLLRALQERVVRPVGCDREVEIDVRVIAATHRDLVKEVAEGRFREDLFYRLNVVTIDIPPLRERGDDVLLMAEHFIQEVAARDQSESPRLTTGAVEALVGYRWPGNVRELKNCVEYAMALSNGDAIGREHLPEIIARASGEVSKKPDPEDTGESGPFETLFAVERRHVLRVYRAVGGNKSKAARILGVDRKTLHARLQRYGAD